VWWIGISEDLLMHCALSAWPAVCAGLFLPYFLRLSIAFPAFLARDTRFLSSSFLFSCFPPFGLARLGSLVYSAADTRDQGKERAHTLFAPVLHSAFRFFLVLFDSSSMAMTTGTTQLEFWGAWA
jgi:hypothetical protein